ncbi:hypothetical protein EYF80_004904 [Liparis tanakae]|uniref:Uncharacterized protein n=1 Tax=Liparis tanakae TaxID=230148 RepID=A0A4Z2J3R2_9TELE|nr:hypothetical protein EYF80_004904 [Liparis tanakae]
MGRLDGLLRDSGGGRHADMASSSCSSSWTGSMSSKRGSGGGGKGMDRDRDRDSSSSGGGVGGGEGGGSSSRSRCWCSSSLSSWYSSSTLWSSRWISRLLGHCLMASFRSSKASGNCLERRERRLRKSDTLSSLNVLRSSLKPSRGNFLRAYWYRCAASFTFPFCGTDGEKALKLSPSSMSLLSKMIMMSGLEVAMAHVAGPA